MAIDDLNAEQACLDPIHRDIEGAVMHGKIPAAPFVGYTNNAANIFAGFETIAELLQIDLMLEDSDDVQDRLMNRRQKDALLALIRATSQLMSSQAHDIATRANQSLQQKTESRGQRVV